MQPGPEKAGFLISWGPVGLCCCIADPGAKNRPVLGLAEQKVAGRILDYYLTHPLPPLLIFAGPAGTGKLASAMRFIQMQLCDAGTACGSCSNCRLLIREGEGHPDLVLFPAERVPIGRAEQPEEFTIRWLLQTRIPFAPFHARRRFVVFPAADLLLHEAETALLKTLEEPPPNTHFIFLTNSLDALKDTILSRGVLVPFRRIPVKALEQITGIRDIGDLEILGGALQLADLVQSEAYAVLKARIDDALSHQMGLLELEVWVRDEKERSASMKEMEYTYADFLHAFALLLLQKTRRKGDGPVPAVADFLAGIRMQQGGMIPFHMSRLFFQLNRMLMEDGD